MKKGRWVCGGSWEVSGRLKGGHTAGHQEVDEGQWDAIQQISEIKQEHKLSYRCSLPSPLQKRSKDYKGLQKVMQVLTFCVFFGFGKKFSESWETPCQSRGKLRSSKLAEPPNPLQSLDLFCNGDGNEHL